MAKFINAKDTLKIANYDGRKISLCNIEDKSMKIIFPRMYMPFGISGSHLRLVQPSITSTLQ